MHVLRSPPHESTVFAFHVVRVDPTRASLRACGELDLAAVEDLAKALAAQEKAGRTFIRLDLSAVTFMDCSVLHVLLAAHYRLLAAHGQLILTVVSGPVIKLLSVTHLTDTLLTATAEDTPIDHVPAPRSPLPDELIPNGGAAQ